MANHGNFTDSGNHGKRILYEMGGELCYFLNICAYFKLKTSLFSILPEESSVFFVNQ